MLQIIKRFAISKKKSQGPELKEMSTTRAMVWMSPTFRCLRRRFFI